MESLAGLIVAQPFWLWAALAAMLLIAEVLSGSGWLLWPAASAGATGLLVAATAIGTPAALLVFAVLTLVSTLAARRIFPRRPRTHDGSDINDNVARLVGHQGRASQAFDGRSGRVAIDGKEWAAELDEGEALEPGTLEAGAMVEVVSVQGARLRVRPA